MNTRGSSKSFRPKSFGATRPCPQWSIQKHTRKWVRRATEKPWISQREVMLKEQAPFLFWSVLITSFNSKSTKQITMAFEIGRRGNWRMFWATKAALFWAGSCIPATDLKVYTAFIFRIALLLVKNDSIILLHHFLYQPSYAAWEELNVWMDLGLNPCCKLLLMSLQHPSCSPSVVPVGNTRTLCRPCWLKMACERTNPKCFSAAKTNAWKKKKRPKFAPRSCL